MQVINVVHRRDDSCGRRVVSPLQVLTGFLIYDWIEKPHKQEVIKEVLSLLEKKILEPNSGETHLTPPLFFIGFFFTYFFHPMIFVLDISHTKPYDHTCVSKAFALLREQGRYWSVSCAKLHGFRVDICGVS